MGCCCGSPFVEPDYSIFFHNQPENERFDESKYLSIESHKIHVISWLPAVEPKAIIIIAHGLHEHALRYYELAHALTQQGFGVYAIDHYAHGKSSGRRGLIDDYNILPTTFCKFVEWVQQKYPKLLFFIFAHSMGTLITLISLTRLKNITSVVFSGVPVFTGPGASSPFGIRCLYPLSQTSFAVTLTSFLASVDANGPAAPIILDALTNNTDKIVELKKDPYRYPGEIKNKTAYELLKMLPLVKTAISNLSIPFLALHGAEDSIALPKGSEFLLEHSATPMEKKTLKIYPGYKHELLNEGPDILETIVDYFEAEYNTNLAAAVIEISLVDD